METLRKSSEDLLETIEKELDRLYHLESWDKNVETYTRYIETTYAKLWAQQTSKSKTKRQNEWLAQEGKNSKQFLRRFKTLRRKQTIATIKIQSNPEEYATDSATILREFTLYYATSIFAANQPQESAIDEFLNELDFPRARTDILQSETTQEEWLVAIVKEGRRRLYFKSFNIIII